MLEVDHDAEEPDRIKPLPPQPAFVHTDDYTLVQNITFPCAKVLCMVLRGVSLLETEIITPACVSE